MQDLIWQGSQLRYCTRWLLSRNTESEALRLAEVRTVIVTVVGALTPLQFADFVSVVMMVNGNHLTTRTLASSRVPFPITMFV